MGKPPRFAVDLLMQDFRPWEPVKDLGRCAAARSAVLDRQAGPFGRDWRPPIRRIGENPANAALLARSLIAR